VAQRLCAVSGQEIEHFLSFSLVQLGLSRVQVVNGFWHKCIGKEYHKAAVKVEDLIFGLYFWHEFLLKRYQVARVKACYVSACSSCFWFCGAIFRDVLLLLSPDTK
jgi:hypothetical protein